MNKRTVEEEAKYQETLKQADMRRAFVVLCDLMRARDIKYPFAVIWQTLDDDGNEDYTVMRPSDGDWCGGPWDINHGDKEERMADIVHEHVGKAD